MRSPKYPAFQVAMVSLLFGITLILQPNRWANTPSYANLLELLPAATWGAIYLVTAGLLFVTIRFRQNRWLFAVGHTVGIALFAAWLLAFVVRYATDDGTTIVNIVSWGVFLSRLIQSAVILDDPETPREFEAKERLSDT